MKKILGYLLVSVLLLSGCAAQQLKTGTARQNIGLTNEEVTDLLLRANTHYHHVQSGGRNVGTYETTTYKGIEYRYLSEELNTLDKVILYLQETFTAETTSDVINELNIIEIGGRTAQPNADRDSILDWKRAKLSLMQANDSEITYNAIVPLGDTDKTEEQILSIQYDEGAGWRVKASFQ